MFNFFKRKNKYNSTAAKSELSPKIARLQSRVQDLNIYNAEVALGNMQQEITKASYNLLEDKYYELSTEIDNIERDISRGVAPDTIARRCDALKNAVNGPLVQPDVRDLETDENNARIKSNDESVNSVIRRIGEEENKLERIRDRARGIKDHKSAEFLKLDNEYKRHDRNLKMLKKQLNTLNENSENYNRLNEENMTVGMLESKIVVGKAVRQHNSRIDAEKLGVQIDEVNEAISEQVDNMDKLNSLLDSGYKDESASLEEALAEDSFNDLMDIDSDSILERELNSREN